MCKWASNSAGAIVESCTICWTFKIDELSYWSSKSVTCSTSLATPSHDRAESRSCPMMLEVKEYAASRREWHLLCQRWCWLHCRQQSNGCPEGRSCCKRGNRTPGVLICRSERAKGPRWTKLKWQRNCPELIWVALSASLTEGLGNNITT